MRKALFAVVLVSASFAGGAVVNGPGLRWAQAVVLNRLGIEGDEGDASSPSAPNAAAAAEPIPARPIPPLVVEPPAAAGPAPDADATPRSVAKASRVPPPASPTPAPEGPPPSPLDDLPPLSTALEPERGAPAPSAAADRGETGRKPAEDKSVRRVSLAGPDGDAPAGDWAGVRDTMRRLGVSRYGTEGDPSGRVRFHCVIPLAGRRAVGQHFEAEGDDDLQAALAALKRVALWKATEAGGPPP